MHLLNILDSCVQQKSPHTGRCKSKKVPPTAHGFDGNYAQIHSSEDGTKTSCPSVLVKVSLRTLFCDYPLKANSWVGSAETTKPLVARHCRLCNRILQVIALDRSRGRRIKGDHWALELFILEDFSVPAILAANPSLGNPWSWKAACSTNQCSARPVTNSSTAATAHVMQTKTWASFIGCMVDMLKKAYCGKTFVHMPL